MKPPIPPCGPPWRDAHGKRRTRASWRALREDLRFYYGAHLHRKLFIWFGLAIFITVATIELVGRWQNAAWTKHPHPDHWLLLVPPFVLWVASGKIARRIAQPLYELTQVAKEIGSGNLQARARLRKGGFDEIALLSTSVNDMASRIEKQLADQRELMAGVSHELRTPLARLRVLMEIVRENGSKENTLDQMEQEIVEIDSLVGDLLANARLDFQSLDLRPLEAGDIAARALQRAGIHEKHLHNDAKQTTFAADPTLLARALANLIDNAQKYGRGLTALKTFNEPNGIGFEIADGGPGFANEQPARTEGSLGLGLVLVRRIAAAHGGSLELKNATQTGGGRAQLRFPLSPPVAENSNT